MMLGNINVVKTDSESPKKRNGSSVNAYLILKQEDKILLHLRKNTGYCDGMWSLVAGHVEDGESATQGMIREAYEEIGLNLHPAQIQVVHIMHRKTNRLNVDVFFDCSSWQGKIQNLEPEKCDRLEFFPISSLPSNIVDYNEAALRHILEGKFYSELGWQE
jgi:ADP-ribose pyrophosphatase YjhB (NUDIX family)